MNLVSKDITKSHKCLNHVEFLFQPISNRLCFLHSAATLPFDVKMPIIHTLSFNDSFIWLIHMTHNSWWVIYSYHKTISSRVACKYDDFMIKKILPAHIKMNQPIKTQHFPRMKPSDRRTESCSRVKHSDLMTSLERLGSFEVIFESKTFGTKIDLFWP